MKVIILCGGLGTRLREETEYLPKPMVPIGGRPILWHIMKTYAHYGHKDFVLCLGYKGEIIKDYFRNYHWNTSNVTLKLGRNPEIVYHGRHEEEDWTVTLLETGLNTMTGGRLKQAIEFCDDDRFLLTYGDGLIDSNINELIKVHEKNDGLVTLTAVQPAGRFGELAMDGNTIERFEEKPDDVGLINGGYFVVERTISDYLTDDHCVFEKEPLERVASEGKLKAFSHDGFWQCMDTYREHVMLNDMWDSGKAPWKQWS